MMERIHEFNGLRGIGAIIIAGIVHFWILVYPDFNITEVPFPKLSILYLYGDIVVEMFFVISGFLMAMHHEHVFEANCETGGVKREIFKRFIKLYPAYFWGNVFGGLMILSYRLLYHTNYIHTVDLRGLVVNFLMISQGWGVEIAEFNPTLWCVPVEMLCYVIFFFICFFCTKRKTDILPFYIILIFLGRIGRYYKLDVPFVHAGTSCRGYQNFFMGCLLFHVYGWMKKRYKKFFIASIALINIFILGILWVAYPVLLGDLKFDLEFVFIPSLIILSLSGAFASKILNLSIVQFLGYYSYEIYAVHYPVALFFIIINKCILHKIMDFRIWYWDLIYILSVVFVAVILKRILKLNLLYRLISANDKRSFGFIKTKKC